MIELNLHILKVFELNRDTCSRPLALPSRSLSLDFLDFLGAAQAKMRSKTHFSFSSFR